MAKRDLVAIGGSTGAIPPLRTLLGALPGDFPAAIVVALHVPANSIGIFQTMVSAAGNLDVVAAQEGMKLEPGRIHLAVPDRHLIVIDGTLRLGMGPRENLVRPAIDPMFRSVAAAYGPRAIGIILSGMLNDGASGLRTIKRCGGRALVQAPESCEAAEMPLAALAATAVDLSAQPPLLHEALLKLTREEVPPSNMAAVPADIRLEIDIALGVPLHSDRLATIAKPVALTCPACSGVLSEVNSSVPLRYRCQVGHAYTARTLIEEKESSVDEAMRVALRIIEERAHLVTRMAQEASEVGRSSTAAMYAQRASEYRGYADKLRNVVLANMVQNDPLATDGDITRGQAVTEQADDGSPQ
jgi:two-component system chemotaxis response regulator CheB